jgi:hypothetical protein
MKVILHIFSGRPDPSWELADEEAAELAKRLIDLTPAHHMLPEARRNSKRQSRIPESHQQDALHHSARETDDSQTDETRASNGRS